MAVLVVCPEDAFYFMDMAIGRFNGQTCNS
jgi:hypothetical protein